MENRLKNCQKAIEKKKASLINKAGKNGIYENFGQREVMEITDKFAGKQDQYTRDILREINIFDNWCMNYTG